MSARHRFCQLALSKLGSTVLWAAQGPEAFDCSGLVMWALLAAGAKLKDHSAQGLADETPALVTAPGSAPLEGDLVFYGHDAAHVTHVGIWLEGGRVLSADGATSHVTELSVARANALARVHLHDTAKFRRDLLGIHRNTFVDFIDRVSR